MDFTWKVPPFDVLHHIYRRELSIVPCSIKIPPPNFQKKSEILKISNINPTPKF